MWFLVMIDHRTIAGTIFSNQENHPRIAWVKRIMTLMIYPETIVGRPKQTVVFQSFTEITKRWWVFLHKKMELKPSNANKSSTGYMDFVRQHVTVQS